MEDEKTPEQTALEARHAKAKAMGALLQITIDDDGTPKVLYIKRPTRQVVGLFWAKHDINNIDANEFLLKNTVMKEISDMDIFTNDALFYGASKEINAVIDLIEVKKSTSSTL